MLVLAASVRRGGQSLAAIARAEIGPAAGAATAVAILYIIIIALAGLGIVVVKALGGEEVPMAAGPSWSTPKGRRSTKVLTARRADASTRSPPARPTASARGPASELTFHEPFRLAVPAGSNLVGQPRRARAWSCPRRPEAAGAGEFLGDVHDRLHGADRAVRRLVHVPVPQGEGGRGVAHRRGGRAGGDGRRGAGSRARRCEKYFLLSRERTIAAIAVYGFVASVLPVWLLLCPRDYLSSFLKIGTIALLVVGVILANPGLQAPAVNHQFAHGGGPYFDGPIFPYVFICIMCGAISGFHALVSSGTTPKMVDREGDVRMIGYGAMLMEGLVGVVALIAAAALPNAMYYDINIDLAKRPAVHPGPQGPRRRPRRRRRRRSRRGGRASWSRWRRTSASRSTAGPAARSRWRWAWPGSSRRPCPGMDWLIKYWYHFAIMFEALFILTTIDTGTRIGRFLVQEFLGKLWKPLGDLDWLPASLLATALVVVRLVVLHLHGSVETIWPMFGMANQLLAVIALAVVTTVLVNSGRGRYAPVTLVPMLFVATTTATTGYYEITGKFWRMIDRPRATGPFAGWLNIGLTAMLLVCAAVILVSASGKWLGTLQKTGSGAVPSPDADVDRRSEPDRGDS